MILDNFTGVDGTTLADHSPDSDPNLQWTAEVGTFELLSNALIPTSYNDGDVATIWAGIRNWSLRTSVIPTSSGSTFGAPGIIFRAADGDNFWWWDVDSANDLATLGKRVGSVNSIIVQVPVDATSGTPVELQVDYSGSDITVWYDGTEVLTYSDSELAGNTEVGVRCGKSGAIGTKPSWQWMELTVPQDTWIAWPHPIKADDNPQVALGAAGAWDSTDVNNPNVVYDPDWIDSDKKWILFYTGYKTGTGNIQGLGIAYAPSLDGPWTKEPENPVIGPTDGIYSMNGGVVKQGDTWYSIGGATNATELKLYTSTNLIDWTSQGIVMSGRPGFFDSNGVFDAHLRIREDGTTIEMLYGATDGSVRRIGRATSTDFLNWTREASAFLSLPSWLSATPCGEPSSFVPPGKEGSEMLVSMDASFASADTNRFIVEAVTVDDFATWHWRLKASSAGSGWESAQNFDSFPLLHDGTFYRFFGGADTPGLALDLNIQVGMASGSWSYDSLVYEDLIHVPAPLQFVHVAGKGQ